MLTLYHAWGSTCSQKVRLALAEKGLDYESRLLNLRRFEQFSPDFLAVNPDAVVPVLVHDGFKVRESSIINVYIDEAFPDPPLRPRDAKGRAQVAAWSRFVDDRFHSRASARGRRYAYLLLESPVRPAIENGLAGWTFRSLDGDAMRRAAAALVGTHDFSAFRAAECQANSPVKTLRSLAIERRGAYWRFDFDADAFLHHMVRNIVGSLVVVGSGVRSDGWLAEVLAARDRALAAPTFAPDGLYFLGPYYDAVHEIPDRTPALDWLP